jgi:subtilisin family serine protease
MGGTRASLRYSLAALALVAAVLVGPSGSAGARSAAPSQAPARYIVVLENDVGSSVDVAGQHVGLGVELGQVFSHALKGYTAMLSPDEAARVAADDRVAFVEPDRAIQISQAAQTVPTGVQRIFADENPVIDIDGIDDARIDVDVAVIDTGVSNHSDLNVVSRADCSSGVLCLTGSGSDGNGHGTHVAGTIAAIDNGSGVVGVAPGARIHSVRVCAPTGSCLVSAMVAGIDFVTARAGTIEVANMSLGGPGSSPAVDQAITASTNAGVVNVVAAGNDSEDAAGYFPASHPDVITVSALADSDGTDGGLGGPPACRPASRDEVLADFSNYGSVVEIAAPGVCILSTWRNGGYNTISGTSMATPHVTGAAAVLARGAGDPTDRGDVMAIRQELIAEGNFNWMDDSGDGVKEPLLDVGTLS